MQGFISIPGLSYIYTKTVASIDVEQKVHSILCPFRLFDDHELFDAPLDLIKKSINICENIEVYLLACSVYNILNSVMYIILLNFLSLT